MYQVEKQKVEKSAEKQNKNEAILLQRMFKSL